MKPKIRTIAMLLLLFALLSPQLTAGKRGVTEKDSFQQTLSFSNPNSAKVIEVDNVFGAITVEGYAGNQVEIAVEQTLHASNETHLERARQETALEISESDNRVLLYAEAPYRYDYNRRNRNYRYHAQYDIVLKVPFDSDLILQTVNGGDIWVADVRGNFEVNNVNGRITLNRVAGPCQVTTVNGPIKVNFKAMPAENCSFETVNGDVTLGFDEEPHGDYRMKTFNGEMLSDFEYITIPKQRQFTKAVQGKLTKIKTDGFVTVRIGAGGPTFEMETLNGNLIIHGN